MKNRYRNDYELSEQADSKGRFHTSVTYKGAAFYFRAGPECISARKKILPALNVAAWAVWIGGMVPSSGAMHFLPAALLYVFCALAMASFSGCCFAFRGMNEPLQNRHADRMNNRYPPSALALAVLSGGAFVLGLVGDIIMHAFVSGDVVFFAASAALCGIGGWSFHIRRDLEIYSKKSGKTLI